MISIATLMCGVALACCPSEKACDTATTAEVTPAAMTTAASDCPLACDSAKTTETAQIVNASLESGDEGSCATACSSGASTLAAAAPAMHYRVGDDTMACSVSAASLASEHGTEMHYVVDGVAYESKGEAWVAHEIAMNNFTESLTRVSFNVNGESMTCAVSAEKACASSCSGEEVAMKYQVGPVVFDSADEAVRAAAMAYNAMRSVAMTYEVNGEETHCSVDAASKSESCGQAVEYVVNGAHTTCSKTAGYMLTQERMAAAIAAVESVQG